MEEIKGILTDVIFYNKENGYLVGVLEQDNREDVIVGAMMNPRKGNTLSLKGKWTNHSSYGEQFQFEEYVEEMPQTEEGIIHFLASGVIKGIGTKTAINIVNKFGKDTIEILTNNPERLSEIDGIGSVKAKTVAESFSSHKDMMDVSIFLQEYGVNSGYAMKIYRLYKEKSIEVIKENPYRLATDVFGLGFNTADNIAEKMGVPKDSPYRIESGIFYILNQVVGEGHTFIPAEAFTERTIQILDVRRDDIIETLRVMAMEDKLHMENIENRTVVFPKAYFSAEANVCKNLVKLMNATLKPINNDIDELIERFEIDKKIELAENQKKAVKEAVFDGVYVVTGGPGTGKTTTINTILNVFDESGLKTALAAPTGRAAKRITETSKREAKTIHRLLEYTFSENEESMRFGKNESNPLEVDAIIIDEVSMVDILLMNGLLKAIKPGTRLILVGDADQLPSVGAGNVLRDIIDSEIIPCVQLEEIFRQAKESLIVVNAHRINKGEYPCYNEKDKDFFLIKKGNEQNVLETIKELCDKRLPSYYSEIEVLRDIQVISPSRKGLLGTHSLNKELQDLLNPKAKNKNEKMYKNKIFREGDKVMQIKNNYSITWKRVEDLVDGEGIYNGDVGFIKKIDEEYNEITVIFDDSKIVQYEFSQMEELDLAYAVTVHKSQGSEFPILVMPVVWFPPMLTTRNLLYTAVTRAKQAVVLVGGERFLNGMVDNNKIIERYSGLKNRLRKYLDEGLLL